ncbi:LacI family DNA-binding transcriptional regulator [Leifsonia kafniensis]|uniref:LacI family DNA-binding transcriptional regulator n=1 Tax=Leifsonia kafniensis TaxID=475957 RepID=A0ABP7KXH6_9MICO
MGSVSTPTRRPTLADVASLAGISTAVVSYVINDGPRTVSPATKAKVESAIATLGYRRNPLASALSAGRSNLVGLLVPDSSNAFFSELSRHLEAEGRRRGLLTLLGNTAYKRETEVDYENAFSDLRARGIFVTSVGQGGADADDCPRIYLHSAPLESEGPRVLFDDAGGAFEAVRHLLEHGYTDIHCLTGPNDVGPSGRRELGWLQAMQEAGLPTDDRLHRVSYDRFDAESAVLSILGAEHPPRVIFATTDEQALATMRAAAVLGLRVPEDLAVVGFDGIRETLRGSIRMTTVALPLQQLAVAAYETLDAWLEHGDAQHHMLPGTLVVGDTCGAH